MRCHKKERNYKRISVEGRRPRKENTKENEKLGKHMDRKMMKCYISNSLFYLFNNTF
jgi:hypothetical protein